MPPWILWCRRLLLAAGGLAAMAGVLSGLARVGVGTTWTSRQAADHGPLFVVGVFGTVIGLERAVASGRAWALVVPLLGASTTLALMGGSALAPWLATGGALGLTVLNLLIVRGRPALVGRVIWLGSSLLLLGNVVWAAGRGPRGVVPAWLAFLVLTIAAERLRWSRAVVLPGWARQLLVTLVVFCAISAGAQVLTFGGAERALGADFVLLALWQLRFDTAREAIHEQGMPRFIGTGVRIAQGWLLVAGSLLLWFGWPETGPVHDAVLHAALVGHVLGTVFAHAPTMLASVAAVRVPFTNALYAPVLLLHLSLLTRVAGDIGGSLAVRRAGSLGNAAALMAFAVVAVATASRAARDRATDAD